MEEQCVDEKMARLTMALKCYPVLEGHVSLLLGALVGGKQRGIVDTECTLADRLASILARAPGAVTSGELQQVLKFLTKAGYVSADPATGQMSLTQRGGVLRIAMAIPMENPNQKKTEQMLRNDLGTDWHNALVWLNQNVRTL